MKYLKYIDTFLNEGASNFWPGYGSDDTSDIMSEIRKKTSVVMNKELKNWEKKLLNVKVKKRDILWKNNQERDFWQKMTWVNLVLTALQDYFNVEEELIDKCKIYIDDMLEYENGSYLLKNDYEEFYSTMKITKQRLKELIPTDGFYYSQGFLDEKDRNI